MSEPTRTNIENAPKRTNRHSLLVGQRFGKWTVLAQDKAEVVNRATKATCRCECGNERILSTGALVNGGSTQCRPCALRGVHTAHGDSYGRRSRGARLYRIWVGMVSRCRPSSAYACPNHAGRGITVCAEWAESYIAFKAWALSTGYASHLTLDRWPHKDGSYEPGNCRWATPKQQGRNTRANRLVTAFGETKTAIEWIEDARCTVSRAAFYSRLLSGWDGEQALVTPRLQPGRRGRKLTRD